jgi:hypothetical protein
MKESEEDKLIAKFVGYYQPESEELDEPIDDLWSFEVYASFKECEEEYPYEVIKTYFDDDIEDFSFVDVPQYRYSWDALGPVIKKCLQVSDKTDNKFLRMALQDFELRATYNMCLRIINKYNKNK